MECLLREEGAFRGEERTDAAVGRRDAPKGFGTRAAPGNRAAFFVVVSTPPL